MIKFKGFCKDIKDLPVSELPKNAVQFQEAESNRELTLHSLLFSIPVIVFIACVVLLKRHMSGIAVPFDNDNIIGVLLSFLFVLPHELLHAICFPKTEDISIYFTSFGACCYSSAIISKRRFITMSLFPALILGIIPLLVWLLFSTSGKGWEILYAFSAMNLLCCCGDFYNVYNAIRQMPSGTYQQLSGPHSYWFYLEQ